MNKAFYIVGIVFSVILMIITFYYADEVHSARMDALWDDLYSYDYGGYNSYSYSYSSYDRDNDLTEEAALWSVFFILSFIAIDLLGLLKVKTKTTKVLSIIGLSLSGIFLFWSFGVMSSPGSMSFDEVAPGWLFYCLTMTAFTIIGLVQSIRYSKKGTASVAAQPQEAKDLLDS